MALRPSAVRWLLAGALLLGVLSANGPALAQDHAGDCDELILYNGKIATVDPHNAIVSSVTIRYGQIAATGTAHGIPKHLPCAKTIDLHNRTVIPGLIDNHDHFVVYSRRPGRDVRLETAASGGRCARDDPYQEQNRQRWRMDHIHWRMERGRQLSEKRLPNLAELDSAAPNNPVLLSIGLTGPSSTNTLGKKFFDGKGIAVGADGSLAGGNFGKNASLAAIDALRAMQTAQSLKQGGARGDEVLVEFRPHDSG